VKKRICLLQNLNLVSYVTAWEKQKQLVAQRINNHDLEDILLLLEHPPIYTLGTGASLAYLKFDPQSDDRELIRVDRGGEVTYHCPGQLIGYPILNLRYYRQDLHWYLRQLEEVIILVLNRYGLQGERIAGLTGVWVNGFKVAAIGIKVKGWITMHGFALNICPDLSGFRDIIPCGISDKPVGSLQQFLPEISIGRVRLDIAKSFAEVFNLSLVIIT
jgi:lipoyl(octanoyl) transferase